MKAIKRLKPYYFIIPLALGMFFILSQRTFADEDLAVICQIEQIEQKCKGIEPSECRKLLEKCEAYFQQESDKINSDLQKTQKEKDTLKNKISVLQKKVADLTTQINQSNLVIKDLKLQLEDTTSSIDKTGVKIEDSKQKLANILRNIHEEDQKPFAEIIFAESDISDFFDNLMELEILNNKSTELLKNIKTLKSNLEDQKQSLDGEKQDLEKMVIIQTLQKAENAKTKKDQEYYLGLTEKQYQTQLQQKQEADKKAATIRARIFELIGVSKAPTFGEAYEIAKYVSGLTKVRPALLLAVLTQESNIGKNVGQCYLKNLATGDGVTSGGKPISKVMKPSRDVEPFLQITKELGRDSYNTPVSCPIPSVGGYGGAMGPAQFIPSTWLIYKDRMKSIIGRSADPWNINDAFLAAGLYLANYGATSQEYNGEWKAAMIYFAGTVNTKYRFYGDSVMKIASGYADDIAALEAK